MSGYLYDWLEAWVDIFLTFWKWSVCWHPKRRQRAYPVINRSLDIYKFHSSHVLDTFTNQLSLKIDRSNEKWWYNILNNMKVASILYKLQHMHQSCIPTLREWTWDEWRLEIIENILHYFHRLLPKVKTNHPCAPIINLDLRHEVENTVATSADGWVGYCQVP